MRTTRTFPRARWAAGCMAFLFSVSLLSAAPYVELKTGKRMTGKSIRAKSNGDVILETASGFQTFSKTQYKRAVADKPADFDKAGQLVAQQKFDQAIPLLKGIIDKYKFLGWDERATVALGKVYNQQGKSAEAIAIFEKLFRASPAAAKSDLKWGYYEALVGDGQYSKLERELDRIAAKDDRAAAAKAQILRGDIKMAQGNNEAAAMDYLRTVILFEAQKEQQPEALYKAGEALEKMRDARAKTMFQTAAQKYPGSPWGQKARGK